MQIASFVFLLAAIAAVAVAVADAAYVAHPAHPSPAPPPTVGSLLTELLTAISGLLNWSH